MPSRPCTALATDTAKAETEDGREARTRPRFRPVGSRLGALILALNLLSLLILFVGALALNEWRRGLIEARQESLMAQAELMSNVLGELGITTGVPTPALDEYETARWLRDNFVPVGQRARVFDRDGLPVADSYMVTEAIPGAPLDPALPAATPVPEPDLEAEVEEDRRLEQARLELATEIETALTEGPQAGVRRDESGNRVISVSLPIRHVRQELGVLTLEAADVDEILAAQRAALMPFAIVALVVSLFSSLLLHLFVARPVMRLSAAADSVRLQQTRAISMPDLEERRDEIGDLARSLETMTRALSDRMEAIERFAADVSHEIKNPLTSIRSALETLPLVKAEAQREKLTALLQQDVRRLDRLITDISNASRLDAELARDRPRTVDLTALLSDIVDVYQTSPKPGDVPLHLSINTPGPTRIVGRDGPLGQVIRNLIDNARSFSPPDGSVRLPLDRAPDGSQDIRIRVEDDGPGIPVENLETVFQRFYTSRPKGTQFGSNSGLGLSIVRQIIEAHGGRVWAENITDPDDPDHITGARFVITLTPLHTRP